MTPKRTNAPNARRVAVVTGANRGMGLETCRQLAERGHRVVLTSRDASKGEEAARHLAVGGLDVRHMVLDVASEESIRAFKEGVEAGLGRVDVLVNNAAILLDEDRSVLETDGNAVRATFDTNLLGPLLLCQSFAPAMIDRGWGRIVNVSSGAGQLTSMTDYAPAYSLSKATLNALTRMVADAVHRAGARNVLVNSVDPGWVRTRMGGRAASRSVEQGADTIVWLATLPDGGPSGGFFHDRKAVPW